MHGVDELVNRIMADPPGVHPGAPNNVWSTERGAYELLAELALPDMRTVETGCGSSTAVFAMRGCDHLCATFIQYEADAFRGWCEKHDVDGTRVRFLIGPSERTLPGFEVDRSTLRLSTGITSSPRR